MGCVIFFAGMFTGLSISYIIRKQRRKHVRINTIREQPLLADIKMKDQKEIQLIRFK